MSRQAWRSKRKVLHARTLGGPADGLARQSASLMRFTTRVSSPTATKHFNTSYDMSGNGANHGIAHDCLQLSQLPGNCGRVPRHSPVPKASMQYPSGSPDFKHQIWAVIAADLDGTTGSITSRFGHVDATMSTGTSLPLQALHTYVLHHAHFSVSVGFSSSSFRLPDCSPALISTCPFRRHSPR